MRKRAKRETGKSPVSAGPTRHAQWSHVPHQGSSVCVIHHIRHYQSCNEGFGSTPMLSFLSHSSDGVSLPPTPNNKLSHPFFITQVFQRWSSLKVRGAFLWPEGHHRLNLLDLQWKPRWGWGGRSGGGSIERVHPNLHQRALEQHTVMSLAPVKLLCNLFFFLVKTTKTSKAHKQTTSLHLQMKLVSETVDESVFSNIYHTSDT